MTRSRMLCYAGVSALGMSLIATEAEAARRVLSAEHVEPISRVDGVTRILLSFGALQALGDVEVTGAFIDVDLPGGTPETEFQVAVYTLATPWVNRGATWTTPWRHPGGDVDDTHTQSVTVEAGQVARKLRVNVTAAVRAMIRGDRPANGFMLSVPVHRGDGFGVPERATLGELTGACLEVTFVTVPRGAGRRL
jgi:hypothetical protein